jgi:hypothetical protein
MFIISTTFLCRSSLYTLIQFAKIIQLFDIKKKKQTFSSKSTNLVMLSMSLTFPNGTLLMLSGALPGRNEVFCENSPTPHLT